MDTIYEYKEGTIIHLHLHTNSRIAIQSQKNRFNPVDVKLPAQQQTAWLLERWVIELVDRTLFFREMNNRSDADDIVITCEQPNVESKLTFTNKQNNSASQTFKMVKFTLCSGDMGIIKVITPSSQNTQPQPLPQPQPQPQPSPQTNATIVALQQQVQNLTQLLNARTTQELADLQIEEASIDSQLKINLKDLKNEREKVKKMREKLQEAQDEITKEKATYQSQNQQLTGINHQLDDIKAQQEVLTLDIEKAQKTLEDLRIRNCFDQASTAVIEDNDFMRKGSISQVFADVNGMLEAVERRIAAIAEFRTNYNNEVVRAIGTNGVISVEDEIFHSETESQEEDNYGNGERTSPANAAASEGN